MTNETDKRSFNLGRAAEPWLDRIDQLVYVLVGVFFLVAAIAIGVDSVVHFMRDLFSSSHETNVGDAVTTFVNDLLLVLIILEVLGTVRSYLVDGTTSLKPFLYIGIISATRRILAIGAETTINKSPSEADFRHLMIDLGINGAVVLALAVAVFLFSRQGGGDDDLPKKKLGADAGEHA